MQVIEDNPLRGWFESVKNGNHDLLYDLLDDDFLFYSPVVFKPKDKYMGYIYLLAAAETFLATPDFKYTKKIISDFHAVLEFECTMNEKLINGIDMFTWNENKKFIEMKVLVRPNQALPILQAEMEKNLARPDIWR